MVAVPGWEQSIATTGLPYMSLMTSTRAENTHVVPNCLYRCTGCMVGPESARQSSCSPAGLSSTIRAAGKDPWLCGLSVSIMGTNNCRRNNTYSIFRATLGRIVKRKLDILGKVGSIGKRVLESELLHSLGRQCINRGGFTPVAVL